MSAHVTHFIRGVSKDAAYDVLISILDEGALRGSTRYVRGCHRCVCLTESPVDQFGRNFGRWFGNRLPFQPFGIQFSKQWISHHGGRPVIYQRDAHYPSLPHDLRPFHVTYEPNRNPPVDFSWEREWRVHAGLLHFTPADVNIILPPTYGDLLIQEHDYHEQMFKLQYEAAYDMSYGEPEPFPWKMVYV